MSKIKALDFAKYIDINRKSLIQHCKKNGKYLKDNESLGYIVSLNNTINLEEKSSDLPVRNVYNYDGTLLESTIVNVGDAITLPTEPPVINDPKISFKKWVKSTSSPTVKTSYNIGAICQVKEQIDVDGTLVRPTLIEVVISEAIGLSPMIRWKKESNSSVLYIDWGDGVIDTVSTSATAGNTTHTYQKAGRYTIKMYSLNSYFIYSNSSSNYTFGSKEYQKIVKKVYFGDNVISIGSIAFQYCSSLQSVVIPDSVTSIGNEAFHYCNSLQSVVISDSVTSIGSSTFYYCNSLQSVVIPDSITSIGSDEFRECSSLQSVVIPDSVTSIGNSSFQSCYSLQSVVISDSVTSIGSNAFYGCSSLQSVVIPNGVTSIVNNAFYNCNSLQSVVIPDSVTSIGGYAFYSCYSLQSVVIPNSVTSIGNNAFQSCYSLQSVVIPDSVTSIGGSAFHSCNSLQSVVIPDSVTSIGSYVFYSCKSLQSVVIPDSVTSIGSYAFNSCYSLQSVVIPDSVNSIGSNAFNSCNTIQSIVIPNNWSNNIDFIKNCYSLEDSSWVSIANRIADLTNSDAKVITIDNAQKSQIDTIMVNSLGVEDATGTMTLTEFIQNKNWTISVSN